MRPWSPNFFDIAGFSEIVMFRRKIFGTLLLVKIKVVNFIERSLNLPPPLLYRYNDDSALQLKIFALNLIQPCVLISNLRQIFLKCFTVLFYKSLKLVFEFKICGRKIVEDLLCDVKMTYKTFSFICFSHETFWITKLV